MRGLDLAAISALTSSSVDRIVPYQRHPGRSEGSGMIYDVECVHCQETLLKTTRIGDAEARIVAEHLESRHPGVLDSAVDFDDPGLVKILHHVRVMSR